MRGRFHRPVRWEEAAVLCSGIIVAKYDGPLGDEGHERGQGIRPPQQELDRAA
jgi:hypothetical protein